MTLLEQLKQSVEAGKAKEAVRLTQQAVDEALSAGEILQHGLVAAMAAIGVRYTAGQVFVPEMLLAARAMKQALALLRPLLVQANVASAGKVIIGTVAGDQHDIGKNLVAMMLEGAGFDVVDLGVDVRAEAFVAAVRAHGDARIVALSALLTTSMPGMRTVIAALRAENLPVKVMVGGAPVSAAFAKEIGADGYSEDAAAAAQLALSLMRGETAP